jgi:hypothetical protein
MGWLSPNGRFEINLVRFAANGGKQTTGSQPARDVFGEGEKKYG